MKFSVHRAAFLQYLNTAQTAISGKTTLEILGQTSENKQARLETLANSSTYNSTSTTNNVNINSNINYPKADSKTLMDIPALMYKEVIDAINK